MIATSTTAPTNAKRFIIGNTYVALLGRCSQPAQALKTMATATITRPATMLQPKKRGVGSGITGFSFVPAMVNYRAARRFRTFLPRRTTRPDRLGVFRTAAAARRFGRLADSENRASASTTLSLAVRSVSARPFAKPSAIPRNVPDQICAGCDQQANQKFQGLYINESTFV